MKKLMAIEIFNPKYNLHCFLEPHSLCQQTYRCHTVKIIAAFIQHVFNTCSTFFRDVNLKQSKRFSNHF